jgi:hypothetical protein
MYKIKFIYLNLNIKYITKLLENFKNSKLGELKIVKRATFETTGASK